jgi:hypothetical protein
LRPELTCKRIIAENEFVGPALLKRGLYQPTLCQVHQADELLLRINPGSASQIEARIRVIENSVLGLRLTRRCHYRDQTANNGRMLQCKSREENQCCASREHPNGLIAAANLAVGQSITRPQG